MRHVEAIANLKEGITVTRIYVKQPDEGPVEELKGDTAFFRGLFANFFATVEDVTGRRLRFRAMEELNNVSGRVQPGQSVEGLAYKYINFFMFDAEDAQFLGYERACLDHAIQHTPGFMAIIAQVRQAVCITSQTDMNIPVSITAVWSRQECTRLCPSLAAPSLSRTLQKVSSCWLLQQWGHSLSKQKHL